jgi:hypothetical protein
MVSSFKKAKENNQTMKSNNFIGNSLLLHLISCAFVTRIYSFNWSWIRSMWCLMAYEPHPTSQKQLHFHIFWNVIKIDDYIHFSSSLSSKLTLVTSNSCICNYKPLLVVFTNIGHFYHGATKDNRINIWKNGWFEHKSQMCGLVWTKFLVM